jgi:formylglycine-generating enzyme required for sulfatase activity
MKQNGPQAPNLKSAAGYSAWPLLAVTVLLLAGACFAAWKYIAAPAPAATATNSPEFCDPKTSQLKPEKAPANSPLGEPPVIDTTKPSAPAPEGMVWIPAGEFSMGSNEEAFIDARPIHRVRVKGFWMDKTEVTNEQFAKFVKATGYVTVAERKPTAEDFPGAPPENLVAGSVVFSPPPTAVPLDDHFQWWSYVPGANWRHPQGPKSDIRGQEKHPVVHIAYDDAIAYAKWAGGRLPTEAEFEWAARGGLDRKKYVWGDEFRPDEKFCTNSFQGHFPDKNTAEDGFVTTAPVASFEPNGFGLFDVAGNVWEWCYDWYRADYYKTLAAAGVADNPQGPKDSDDPSEPGTPKRVHKGGSFLCTDQYCSRYMPGGRGKGEPSSGTNHIGFRIVRDAS